MISSTKHYEDWTVQTATKLGYIEHQKPLPETKTVQKKSGNSTLNYF